MTALTDDDFRSAYAGRRVCVTGGAGFIGSHLCHALARHGARVRVIDDLSHGLRENLRLSLLQSPYMRSHNNLRDRPAER